MSRRVLIVADDPALLEVLRRMLPAHRAEWESAFVPTAADALDRMAEGPFAVLLADAQSGGSPCEELLAGVRRKHPQAVRIVLTTEADRGRLVNLLSLAHRALTKPFTAADLQTALRRACSLQDMLLSPALTAVVGRLGSLPTLPALYTRIVAELARPNYSIDEVGDLVAQDVGMAAKLIQVANSALIGLRWPISTPAQAVRILGSEWTKSLALAAGVFSRYDPHALKPFSIEELWEHSRQVAALATRIAHAERAGSVVARDAAIGGLFHDIGRLTLASQLPGPYREVLALTQAAGMCVAEAEQTVFGATHAEVGAYLLGLWGLPDSLIEAVAWHHTPSRCPGGAFTPLTAIHAADAILDHHEVDAVYLTRLGLERHLPEWKALARAPEPVANEA
jgi:putative nucleotidyltransferase with HDIG domain